MQPNQKISEGLSILASIDPVSQGAGTASTGWVSGQYMQQLMGIVSTGLLGASATVDAKIQQATDSSGTGAKDVTGKAITQIVKASGDQKQATISFRGADLDVNNGFTYFRLSITVGTAASLIAGYLVGLPRFDDASNFNQAGVVQSV